MSTNEKIVTVYGVSSMGCSSRRKAIKWLESHNIQYKVRNTAIHPLCRDELLQLLKLCENGFEELLASRSTTYQNLMYSNVDLSFEDLVTYILTHPTLVRDPIVTDGRKIACGFQEDTIRVFIGKKQRKMERKMAQAKLSYYP
jgi:regulatory protein spx